MSLIRSINLSPWLAILTTSLQIIQMVFGLAITLTVLHYKQTGKNMRNHLWICPTIQVHVQTYINNPRILYCTRILRLYMLVQCVWLFRHYCSSINLKFQKCVIRHGSDNCVLLFFSNVAMSEIALWEDFIESKWNLSQDLNFCCSFKVRYSFK